ncbi:MAG: hypothetical protein ACOC8H_01610 [bacterium]
MGALFQPGGCGDDRLRRVVESWPMLPESTKRSILRAVEAATGGG